MSGDARAGFPKVLSRRLMPLSQWMTVVEKAVCFREGAAPEVYHSVTQAPYVAILALTADGLIPIVRQFRPAVEAYTWEFPAGTVDEGEDPAATAVRELREETGLMATEVHEIGPYYPDTGRLSVGSTAFFVRCRAAAAADYVPEPGIEVRAVTRRELFELIRTGEFRHQLHVALVASALIHGHLGLTE
jgi:ADP-ribose pyrophosphatase